MESLSPGIDAVDSARSQFIGILLNWGLYGILVSQTCAYVITFSHDLRINKGIVFAVFSLETVQTAILTYDLYDTFVLHFGDVDYLQRLGYQWLTVPIFCGIVGSIAELFYAWRIYKISRSKRISAFVTIFSFAQLGCAFTEGMRARSAESVSGLRPTDDALKSILPGILWTISMLTCDIVIAVVMTYYVLKLRREFYYDSSFFVRRLLSLTVETGSVTALVAVASGVLFVGMPDSQAFNIPGFIIGKLYAISLLRVLINRSRTECTAEIFTLPISFESPAGSQNTRSKDEGSNVSSVRWRRRDDGVV